MTLQLFTLATSTIIGIIFLIPLKITLLFKETNTVEELLVCFWLRLSTKLRVFFLFVFDC